MCTFRAFKKRFDIEKTSIERIFLTIEYKIEFGLNRDRYRKFV